MATLKLRGIPQVYPLSQSDAKEVKEIWNSNLYRPDHKIDLGQLSFEKSDIKMIELDGQKQDDGRLDLDDPVIRQAVKDFEKEILSYFETAEYKTFENFLADKKIIKITRQRTHYADYDLIDGRVGEYDVYKKLWSGVNSLRVRRKYAGANPPLENLVEEKKRLEKKISYPKDEIDPAEMPF